MIFLFLNSGFAVEGFFQPEQMELLAEELELSNIRISTDLLGNRNGSLLQSVVSLGNCSGVFVSTNGLILTNKHCLYLDAETIAQHSNPQRPQEEYTLPNMQIYLFDSYQDISKEMNRKEYSEKDISKNKEKLLRRCKGHCEIIQGPNDRFYLLKYSVYKDIRAVYVPPLSIASYDGGVDNWSWPQHNGDFAFIRIYTDEKGLSDKFDPKNIPYANPSYVSVSSSPDRNNVLAIGYPAYTSRHESPNCYISNYVKVQSTYEFLQHSIKKTMHASTHAILLEELQTYKKKMSTYPPLTHFDSIQISDSSVDETKRIHTISYLQNLMNTHTNWFRQIQMYLEDYTILSEDDLKESYWLLEIGDSYRSDIQFAKDILNLLDQAHISPNDLQVLMKRFETVEIEKPPSKEQWLTFMTDLQNIDTAKNLHPIFQIHMNLIGIYEEKANLQNTFSKPQSQIPKPLTYVDAQDDIRISFGTVSGYYQNEVIYFGHQTSTQGFPQKHTDLPSWFTEENIASSPYYQSHLQGIPINFISDIDGARGSSGSPTLNEKGELVGIVFDKNQYPEIFDCVYDNKTGRTVHVDIQYILWNLQHDAPYVYQEIHSQ